MPDSPPIHYSNTDTPAPLAAEPRKGFIFCYFASFVLVLLAVYGVNFAGNASGLFPSPWRPGMSERGWKTRRFDELVKGGRAPKVLVMGSSRTMQIQPPYLAAVTGKPAFNYGVSVGSPIDFIAQLRHAIQTGATPETLVVGVDEQAFGDFANYYTYVLQNGSDWGLYHNLPLRDELKVGGKVLGAVTVDTTVASVDSLIHPLPPLAANTRRAEIMLGDGYLIYPARVKERATGNYDLNFLVERQAHNSHRNVPPSAWNVTDRKKHLFREFLELARSKGVQVRVMLLPLHPHFEAMVMTKSMRAQRNKLAALLAKDCAETGATFRDFTHLETYAGDPDEFWDGLHQTPENLRRMINVLFDLPPDKLVATVPTDADLLNHLPAVTTLTTR